MRREVATGQRRLRGGFAEEMSLFCALVKASQVSLTSYGPDADSEASPGRCLPGMIGLSDRKACVCICQELAKVDVCIFLLQMTNFSEPFQSLYWFSITSLEYAKDMFKVCLLPFYT